MIDSIKKALVSLALLVGGTAAAYAFLLDDNAKQSVKKALGTVKSSVSTLGELAAEAKGTIVEGDLPNREDALRQWQEIGF